MKVTNSTPYVQTETKYGRETSDMAATFICPTEQISLKVHIDIKLGTTVNSGTFKQLTVYSRLQFQLNFGITSPCFWLTVGKIDKIKNKGREDSFKNKTK